MNMKYYVNYISHLLASRNWNWTKKFSTYKKRDQLFDSWYRGNEVLLVSHDFNYLMTERGENGDILNRFLLAFLEVEKSI